MAPERFTVRVDADAGEWIDEQQDRYDQSRAWVIREAVDLARGEESVFGAERTGAHRGDAHRTGADRTGDLRDRVAELEERLAAVEDAVSSRENDAIDSMPADGRAETPEGQEDDSLSPTGSNGRGSPRTGGDLRQRVEDVAESWAADGRKADRIDAAVAAIEAARQRGSLGKSEAIADLEPSYPVEGQDGETWWRKNVRPVLQELGTYDSGRRGYRVELD